MENLKKAFSAKTHIDHPTLDIDAGRSGIDQGPFKGLVECEGDIIDHDYDSYITTLSHHFCEIAKKENLPLKVEDWENKDGARILDAIKIIKKYILNK